MLSGKNKILGQSIYAPIEINYKDEYVLVQETRSQVGYKPQRFVASRTIAFPPIGDKEIWTVGFVQVIVNDSGRFRIIQKYRNRKTDNVSSRFMFSYCLFLNL